MSTKYGFVAQESCRVKAHVRLLKEYQKVSIMLSPVFKHPMKSYSRCPSETWISSVLSMYINVYVVHMHYRILQNYVLGCR